MMNITTFVKASVATAIMLASVVSFAVDIDANADENGLAIKGYDTVAYFTMDKPVMGNAEFTAQHKNSTYQFVNAKHRDLFIADTAKYAPQFGAFCAMGVRMGLKFDTDPTAWRIVEGKLYLNLNKDVQKAWLRDVPGNLKIAEKNWPEIKGLTAAEAKAKNG